MGDMNYWFLIKTTFSDWNRHKATQMAAALAYFTTFSIAPLLFLSVTIAGLVFGEQTARDEVVHYAETLIGADGAAAIQTIISNIPQPSSLTTAVGLAALVIGATTVFGYLQDAMNTIWGVQPAPRRPDMDGRLWLVVDYLRKRFIAFAILVGTGFLLLVSLIVSTLLAILGAVVNMLVADSLVPVVQFLMQLLTFVVTLGGITLLLAMAFKVLPDTRVAWRDVTPGAVITALLLTIGKSLIGLYLGQSSITSVFGAAGSVLVILIWVYYSAQILFLGAEFTQVYARTYGSHARRPSEAAPDAESCN
ncbi:MAG: YihY/virulence factor BrkB family protein [Chloroflexi bacterium]|nr:YihY/virulence factor BrkB family protein [Chloroflexota bacterium]